MAETRALKRMWKTIEQIKVQTININNTTRISEIKAFLSLLSDEWNDFQTLEKNVKGKFDDANVELVEKIETGHYELKQKLVRLEKSLELDDNNRGVNTMDDLIMNQTNFLHEVSNLNKRESEVRLPRVNIPTFNGKYSEFPSFRDLFQASIHDNCNITKVHKFQYLKGLLKGEAFALINHLNITEANYDEAWAKVKARYDKIKHVVRDLMKQFMEQPILRQCCSKSLRQLVEGSDEVIRGLKALGTAAEARDPWLIHILTNKLDNDSKEAWAHATAEDDFPSLDTFFKFLNKRSDALESLDSMQKMKPGYTKRVTTMVSQTQVLCPLCAEQHYLGQCAKYIELPVTERKRVVAEKKLCFNCLSSTHQAVVCRSRFNCKMCKRRHHVTLHAEDNAEKKGIQAESNNFNAIMQSPLTNQIQGILPTASVIITNKFGKAYRCRALLDCGSQSSFVSEDCVQRLQLKRERANVNITGITTSSIQSRGRSVIVMGSLYDPNVRITVDALILTKLPQRIPGCHLTTRDLPPRGNLPLADPEFDRPGQIDILIGADKFFSLLNHEQKRFRATILQRTVFGWVVSGQSEQLSEFKATTLMATTSNIHQDINIDETLRKFWEIEDLPQTQRTSPEDEECETFYDKTVKRQSDGRYMVQLPFRKTSTKLGNSLLMASKRFLATERKLSNDIQLRNQYIQQMREYVEKGHMVEIHQSQLNLRDEEIFYLPHHAVIKQSSDTTRVRIVFDGSAKTTNGTSLNDILMVGPTIQPTLWVTLLKFRYNRIAITADIEKMYRQVIVAPNDTNYQRVLWRENPREQIRHYRLTRVTFGLACSAYLAIRTLQRLASDCGDRDILQQVIHNFYVDDYLSGCNNVQDAIEQKKRIADTLHKGGFSLRKWRSNVRSLSDECDSEETTRLYSDANTTITILGLHWRPCDDAFTFKVNPENEGLITKRKLLSEASRVFDPLGFLAPSVVILKALFQKMWFLKIDWDDVLPERYKAEYKRVRDEFRYFEEVKIPRFTDQDGDVQIHGFADASEIAYSAVVYCRSTSDKGEINIHLLTAKSKVTPVKKLSIPRLELCAAHLLAKLMDAVRTTMKPTTKYYAWTDSVIVLSWLSTYPAKWKTFVANRTSQILDRFPRQHWDHVRSNDNPADHGSRGVSPQKLISLKQWWEGPEWLKLSQELWPTLTENNVRSNQTAIEKECSKTMFINYTLQVTVENDWLNIIFIKKSKLKQILRIIAYVRRFITNSRCKSIRDRNTYELNAREIEQARTQCISWVQNNTFSEDMTNLIKNKIVRNSSKLMSLAPFIDAAGILRVGGRLFNADCDFDSKHPVILPADHTFTTKLIWETHLENLHAGPTLTSNIIRQRYWIMNGRTRIRSLLKTCVICVKHAHRRSQQLMGSLPKERVMPTRPFANCGIDFAGPLYFVTRRGRGATHPIKGYLCIFVCMSVKAVHVEPVSDLTSDAFLAALKRFTARRGIPQKIHTDNGSNFIGARRILNEAHNLIMSIKQNYVISEFLSSNRIEWHVIPPHSPRFGGLWESAVKSVKTHLLKSTSNINLTFEEMVTLLCQIENILNSRPLSTTSNGDDYEVLTPAHFLIGTSSGSIPEPEIANKADSSLSRWQRIQSRVQTFWNKYYIDYLNTLQQRHKWQKKTENIQINDIVIIREDNTPVSKWLIGRIIQIHPRPDDHVRVVTIKTASSTIQRPVVKLCKLPIS